MLGGAELTLYHGESALPLLMAEGASLEWVRVYPPKVATRAGMDTVSIAVRVRALAVHVRTVVSMVVVTI